MKILEVLGLVKSTPGTNDKKDILKNNMSELLKQIFYDTYDEQVKYYVTKKRIEGKVEDHGGIRTIDNNYQDFHNTLVDLSERRITGNAAVERLTFIINLFDKESQELLLAIVDRNLKIGVSLDNFNKVLGKDSKPVYEVSLAVNITEAPNVNPIDGTYFASRKLDGVRCEAHIHNYYDELGCLIQEITFKSRQGKEFTTLDNLKVAVREFTRNLEGDWVLDGECCLIDLNGKENFNGIMQEITRKNHTIVRPMYMLFDMITQDEFDGKVISPIYSERIDRLKRLYIAGNEESDRCIRMLTQERLTTQEQFDTWSGYVNKYHWEGFMLHKDAPYKSGRTKDLLKVKLFKDAEYTVKDVKRGRMSFNENGIVERDVISALIIEHKGTQVDVGSGLSKEQRMQWFEHPEEIIGKTITVQYFSETTNKNTNEISLRFPVLKYVYENGRNI